MKLFHSVVIVCYALAGFFPHLKESIYFYLHQNELTAYYQKTILTHSQIPYLKHFRFS